MPSWDYLSLIMKKPKALLLLTSLSLAVSGPAFAVEMMSLNFYRIPNGNFDWQSRLAVAPDQAAGFGDWNTTGWQNYNLPWSLSSPAPALTLTGTEGSTATFVLKDTRNGGPYAGGGALRTTLVGDANGNMMDGHGNGTEDPGDRTLIFDFEVTNIPFETFDVVIYLGANSAQFGDGNGQAVINGGPEQDFTLTSGAFNGTFTEITPIQTTGNYLIYKGLEGGSFDAQVWGTGSNGFNHIGPTGIQIVESNEVRQPLGIADISLDDTTGEITLNLKSNPGEFYGIYWSDDLVTFQPGVNPAVTANPDGILTTVGPFPSPSPTSEKIFFRIGAPDLKDPTFDRVWGNGTTVNLTFSEAMQATLGTNPSNFNIVIGGDGLIAVESAEISASGDTITLTTAIPLFLDSEFTVFVNNLTDVSGRPVSGPTSKVFRTWDDNPNGVKVFILAGQSNMQGHGRNEEGLNSVNGAIGSLRYQVANDPSNYGKLVDGEGNWIARDDVKVFYNRGDLGAGPNLKKGNLLPEFGVSNAQLGPEFGFGWAMGEALDEPVLIIKTSWGGKSLYADFRSPEAVAKRGGEVGNYYVGIFDYVHAALDNLDTEFPEWAGLGYEIAGFGWHQGWNDSLSNFTASQYEANMVDLIKDIRSEFGKPALPVSIANTGISGASASGSLLTMLEGQLAVGNATLHPEFEGNVSSSDTRDFWRESSVSPRNQGFHWNQNGETYYLIGEAMGQGMEELLAR
jgi:hypothetical protein